MLQTYLNYFHFLDTHRGSINHVICVEQPVFLLEEIATDRNILMLAVYKKYVVDCRYSEKNTVSQTSQDEIYTQQYYE